MILEGIGPRWMRVRIGKILRWGESFKSRRSAEEKKVEGAKKIANSINGFLNAIWENLDGIFKRNITSRIKEVGPALLSSQASAGTLETSLGYYLWQTLTNQKKRRQQLRAVRAWNQITALLSILNPGPFRTTELLATLRLHSYPSLTAPQNFLISWYSSYITHLSWQAFASPPSPIHRAHPLSSVRPVSNVSSSWGSLPPNLKKPLPSPVFGTCFSISAGCYSHNIIIHLFHCVSCLLSRRQVPGRLGTCLVPIPSLSW